MLNQTSLRTARLALAAVILGLAAPASAQTAPPAAPAQVVAPSSVQVQDVQIPTTGPVVPLTMEEAVNLALQNNLGLQSDRMNLDIAASNIAGARSAFLPRLNTSFSRNSSSQQGLQNPDGTTNVSSSTQLSTSSSLQGQLPWYGSSYSVNWSAGRRETPGSSASFNPSINSSFSFNFSQPLWGGLMVDSARFGLESSQRQQVITDLGLRQSMIALDANVRLAYLNLVAAREGYKVAVQNLAIAEESLRNSQARVAVGVAPQTDIVGDEAQVATSRVNVIQREAEIAANEDALRAIILDPERPDYWDVNLVPTDEILLTDRQIDLDAVIQEALDNRIDRQIAMRQRELTDLTLELSRENTKPSLSLGVNYSAGAFGGQSAVLGDRSFGTVLSETFGGDYPSWSTQLQFSYPLGLNQAKAAYARAQIQRDQEDLTLQQLDLLIIQEVRDAVRRVNNAFRQVEAARTALEANQLNLQNEERKLQVGLSRSLDVQIRQQSLAQARVGELNAIIAYNRALINLDRVTRIR